MQCSIKIPTAGAAIDDAVLKQPTIETQAGMIYEQISIRMGQMVLHHSKPSVESSNIDNTVNFQ